MSLIRKHGAVLQAWACLDLVLLIIETLNGYQAKLTLKSSASAIHQPKLQDQKYQTNAYLTIRLNVHLCKYLIFY